jgi:ribonuclease E
VGEVGDNDESDDESEEQNGEARADQGPGGERRPRRRGRRGGRRRRGGQENGQPEDGVAASIADDLGPLPESESADAVADLSSDTTPQRDELPAPYTPPEPVSHHISTAEDLKTEPDAEPAPRKRSTVREKVSFFFGDSSKVDEEPVPTEAAVSSAVTSEPTPAAPQPEAAHETPQPRRAGWWSRRSE